MEKRSDSQASWALVTEGVTATRLELHRLQRLCARALSLVKDSDHRDHLYQVAGDLIHEFPSKLVSAVGHCDRASYALSKLGQDVLKGRIPHSDKALVDTSFEAVPNVVLRVAQRYAYSQPASQLPGVSTFVNERSQKNLPSNEKNSPEDNYLDRPSTPENRKQVMPIAPGHPKSRDRDSLKGPQQTSYNVPPVSEKAPEGKSLSKDRVRTKGVPGEDYGHPYIDQGTMIKQRRTTKTSDFLYEKRPPEMEPGSWVDRATHWDAEDPPPAAELEDIKVRNNPGSAKVIPPNHPQMVNKQAYTYAQVLNNTGAKVIERSQGLPVKLSKVDRRNKMWWFSVKGSSGKTYRVKVKVKKEGSTPMLKDADVEFTCSCPFWRWQGPEYHGVTNGYQYKKPRGTASTPDIRDPSPREHYACKHVVAVINKRLDPYEYEVFQPRRKKLARSVSVKYLESLQEER